jgi:hypothetical protein
MSIITGSFIGQLFPELDWKELDANSYDEIYKKLRGAGECSSAAMDFLQRKRVRLGFHRQDFSGGGWTLLHNITLAPDTGLADFYTLSLIIHEVFHLKQPILTRLSVRGELLAWQYQRQAYHEVSGWEIGGLNAAYSGKKDLWDQISRLSPDSREDLAEAQELMKKIAEGYRSDCLPLYPLVSEIMYYLRQGKIRNIFEMVRDLVTCR